MLRHALATVMLSAHMPSLVHVSRSLLRPALAREPVTALELGPALVQAARPLLTRVTRPSASYLAVFQDRQTSESWDACSPMVQAGFLRRRVGLRLRKRK